MGSDRRISRLNSLLREVISEVIHRDLHESDRFQFASVGSVELSRDLHYAKVYVGFCAGSPAEQAELLALLEKSAGAIGSLASRKVVLRFFPTLTFHPDLSVERHQQIGRVMDEVAEERHQREELADGEP